MATAVVRELVDIAGREGVGRLWLHATSGGATSTRRRASKIGALRGCSWCCKVKGRGLGYQPGLPTLGVVEPALLGVGQVGGRVVGDGAAQEL